MTRTIQPTNLPRISNKITRQFRLLSLEYITFPRPCLYSLPSLCCALYTNQRYIGTRYTEVSLYSEIAETSIFASESRLCGLIVIAFARIAVFASQLCSQNNRVASPETVTSSIAINMPLWRSLPSLHLSAEWINLHWQWIAKRLQCFCIRRTFYEWCGNYGVWYWCDMLGTRPGRAFGYYSWVCYSLGYNKLDKLYTWAQRNRYVIRFGTKFGLCHTAGYSNMGMLSTSAPQPRVSYTLGYTDMWMSYIWAPRPGYALYLGTMTAPKNWKDNNFPSFTVMANHSVVGLFS